MSAQYPVAMTTILHHRADFSQWRLSLMCIRMLIYWTQPEVAMATANQHVGGVDVEMLILFLCSML